MDLHLELPGLMKFYNNLQRLSEDFYEIKKGQIELNSICPFVCWVTRIRT